MFKEFDDGNYFSKAASIGSEKIEEMITIGENGKVIGENDLGI
jgi:hypothetical protein